MQLQQTHQQYQKKIADLVNLLRQKATTTTPTYLAAQQTNQQWTPPAFQQMPQYPFQQGQYFNQFQSGGRGNRQFLPQGARGGEQGHHFCAPECYLSDGPCWRNPGIC